MLIYAHYIWDNRNYAVPLFLATWAFYLLYVNKQLRNQIESAFTTSSPNLKKISSFCVEEEVASATEDYVSDKIWKTYGQNEQNSLSKSYSQSIFSLSSVDALNTTVEKWLENLSPHPHVVTSQQLFSDWTENVLSDSEEEETLSCISSLPDSCFSSKSLMRRKLEDFDWVDDAYHFLTLAQSLSDEAVGPKEALLSLSDANKIRDLVMERNAELGHIVRAATKFQDSAKALESFCYNARYVVGGVPDVHSAYSL